MNTKITKIEIAEKFGYADPSAFKNWTKKDALKDRFTWLKTSAILMQNGFNHFEVLGLAERNIALKAEVKALEEAINSYADKIEQFQELIK